MKPMKTKALSWLPAAIALALLLYLTAQSPLQTMQTSGRIQRWLIAFFEGFHHVPAWVRDMHTVRSLAHVPEYWILGCCLWIGFRATAARPAMWTFAAGGVIGLMDEALKAVLPDRHFELGDWGLDLLGLLLALGFMLLIRSGRRERA